MASSEAYTKSHNNNNNTNKTAQTMTTAVLKKKDYYQFCYDENEVVSSNESSFDEDTLSLNTPVDELENENVYKEQKLLEDQEETLEENPYIQEEVGCEEEHDQEEATLNVGNSEGFAYTTKIYINNKDRSSRISHNAELSDYQQHKISSTKYSALKKGERRSRSCCLEGEHERFQNIETMMDMTSFSNDSMLSSPTSESIELDGYIIEIDEATNTINVSSSPPPQECPDDFFLPSDEYLSSSSQRSSRCIDDDLSSSGVSLDSRLSSANSLTTEIDRLRNISSPRYLKDSPYYQRYSVRNNSNNNIRGFGSDDRLVGRGTAKSLNSLTRSATPDRRTPLIDFLKGKAKITEAKSDFDINKKKGVISSSKTKKLKSKDTSAISIFRLKRSSSSKQKRRDSKHSTGKGKNSGQHSEEELTLQQPSPFVKTIFQFVETDNEEIFPSSSMNYFDEYTVPVFSCNRIKLFQDIGKTNSLSRRPSKMKSNLSSIERTVYQDGHDPIFLSSCRRVSENSDFLISTIAFLDRIRKVQEKIELHPKKCPSRRHTLSSTDNSRVNQELTTELLMDQNEPRYSTNSIRRKLNLPLSLHERFSALSDAEVFKKEEIVLSNDDLSMNCSLQPKSRSFTNLLQPPVNEKKNSFLSTRSKSLKNISYGSFRKKKKNKQNQTPKAMTSHIHHDNQYVCGVKNHVDDFEAHQSPPSHGHLQLDEENSLDDWHTLQDGAVEKTQQNAYQVFTAEQANRHLKTPRKSEQSDGEEMSTTNTNAISYQNIITKTLQDKNINNNNGKGSDIKGSSLTQQSTVNSINGPPQHFERQYKPIRLITDRLRNKHSKNKTQPDQEHFTDQSMEKQEKTNEEICSPKGVSSLRKQFEDQSNNKIGDGKMVDGKEQKEPKRRSGIRRSLSWKIKKDKQQQQQQQRDDNNADQTECATPSNSLAKSPASPKEKVSNSNNKFSSLLSKFEPPVSPQEKKRWKLALSPTSRRSQRKTVKELNDTGTQTDSATEESDYCSSPTHYDQNTVLRKTSGSSDSRKHSNTSNGRKHSIEMLNEIISNSPTLHIKNAGNGQWSIDESKQSQVNKGKILPSEIASNTVQRNCSKSPTTMTRTEDKIIVDVPLHLLPPESTTAKKSSPKSTPKSTSRRDISIKSPRPPASLKTISTNRRISDNSDLQHGNSSSEVSYTNDTNDSSANYNSDSETTLQSEGLNKDYEINNNSFSNAKKGNSTKELNSDEYAEEHSKVTEKTSANTMLSPGATSTPVIKSKQLKSRSVAVVKPKTLASNIAMVSPIMKSEMESPFQNADQIDQDKHSNDEDDGIYTRNPFRSVKRRIILQKWKNLEKSDTETTETTITAAPPAPRPLRRAHSFGQRRRGVNIEREDLSNENNEDNSMTLPKVYRRRQRCSDTNASTSASNKEKDNNNKFDISVDNNTNRNKTSPKLNTISPLDSEKLTSISQITSAIDELAAKDETKNRELVEILKDTSKTTLRRSRSRRRTNNPTTIQPAAKSDTTPTPATKQYETTEKTIMRRKYLNTPTKDDKISSSTENLSSNEDSSNSIKPEENSKKVAEKVNLDENNSILLDTNVISPFPVTNSTSSLKDNSIVKLSNGLINYDEKNSVELCTNLKPRKKLPIAPPLKEEKVLETKEENRKQRTTVDGKPIGYATKIVSPSNKSLQILRSNSSNTNHFQTDSNARREKNLDLYIERSFGVIKKSRDSAREIDFKEDPQKQSASTSHMLKKYEDSPSRERSSLRDRILQRSKADKGNKTTNNNNTEIKLSDNDVKCSVTQPKDKERIIDILHDTDSKDVINNSRLSNRRSYLKTDIISMSNIKDNTKIDLKVNEIDDIDTTNTMKEFEAFLRKQERKAKREIRRISQEEPLSAQQSGSEKRQWEERKQRIIIRDEDYTLEKYRKHQQMRKKERLEFQKHHLSERRRSLGLLPNKWASASNIFLRSTLDKDQPRKLSLPSDIHKHSSEDHSVSAVQDQSPIGRTSSRSAQLKDAVVYSGSLDLGKTNAFPVTGLHTRCNSTGHSPEPSDFFGHLICDIEEEHSDNEDDFKMQQLEIYNSNLNAMKSSSMDSLRRTSSLTRERRKRPLRRTRSENHLAKPLSPKRLRSRRMKSPSERTKNHQATEEWNAIKELKISLLLDQDSGRKNALRIETLAVDNITSYQDVEELSIQTFIEHLKLLDSQLLDIGQDDITYLQFGKKKVSVGSYLDLSCVNTADGILPCQLCLKGKKEWSLAGMAYDTLIPKTYLEKYVSLILTNRQVIFYGPSGTGKSYVARRIATIITQRMNENRIPTIVFKNITESQWKTLLRSISEDKKSEPYVVLLDGFAPSFIKGEKDLTEIISACETVHPQPYVICTVTQSPNYEIPTSWQNSFKWIWLPNHEEPVDGLLQRFLRRKYLQTGRKEHREEAFRIADWLAATWRHINEIIEKYNSTECTIGPTMFYTCPNDIGTSEEWFVDLWNYSLTPYFIQTVKLGLKLYGQRYEWLDPLETILKTYPWAASEEDRKSKLRRIRPEDVGYQPNTSSAPSSPTQYTESEKERLLDFLRQLELLMHEGSIGDLASFEGATLDTIESAI